MTRNLKDFPKTLPYDGKKSWTYDDIFPSNTPYKLISAFIHHNYNMNFHHHDFYEVNIILSGEGIHYTLNDRYLTSVGDIFIIPPQVVHGYHNIDSLDVCHILINRKFLNRYESELRLLSTYNLLFKNHTISNKNLSPYYCHLEGEKYKDLVEEFTKLMVLDSKTLGTYSDQKISDFLLTYSQAFSFIVKLCEAFKENYLIKESALNKKEYMDLVNVLEYINNHYSEKITIEKLCSISYLSKTALTRKISEYTGMSPTNYLNYYRVQMAKRMLLETKLPISQIAISCGFYDSSHLFKTFNKFEKTDVATLRKIIN